MPQLTQLLDSDLSAAVFDDQLLGEHDGDAVRRQVAALRRWLLEDPAHCEAVARRCHGQYLTGTRNSVIDVIVVVAVADCFSQPCTAT